MGFDNPFHLRRSMISELLIKLQIYFLLILLLPALKGGVVQANAPIARPGCNDTCGSVSIPFPFGIGVGCFRDPWFEIECKKTSPDSMAKPFLSKFNFEIMEIKFIGLDKNYDDQPQILILMIPPLKAQSHQQNNNISLMGSPYTIIPEENVFVMEGCPGSAVLVDPNNKVMAGCATVCQNNSDSVIPANSCYGVECCQTLSIHPSSGLDFKFYQIYFNSQGSNENRLVGTLIKSDNATQNARSILLCSASSTVLELDRQYQSWQQF